MPSDLAGAIEEVIAGQVFKGRRTSLRAGSASQVFARSRTASEDKHAGHGPAVRANVGHAFKAFLPHQSWMSLDGHRTSLPDRPTSGSPERITDPNTTPVSAPVEGRRGRPFPQPDSPAHRCRELPFPPEPPSSADIEEPPHEAVVL